MYREAIYDFDLSRYIGSHREDPPLELSHFRREDAEET